MEKQLNGKKVMILVGNGVDEAVMSTIQRELVKTGAVLKTVGIAPGLVNSWNSATNGWGLYFPVDQQISQTLAVDFDALIVPAGARGVQKLADSAHSERILSSFMTAGKPMVFAGDAVELLDKTGLGGQKANANVLAAENTVDVAAMVAHCSADRQPVRAAA